MLLVFLLLCQENHFTYVLRNWRGNFKIHIGSVSEYLNDVIPNKYENAYNTRNKGRFIVQKCRLELIEKSYEPVAVKLGNLFSLIKSRPLIPPTTTIFFFFAMSVRWAYIEKKNRGSEIECLVLIRPNELNAEGEKRSWTI